MGKRSRSPIRERKTGFQKADLTALGIDAPATIPALSPPPPGAAGPQGGVMSLAERMGLPQEPPLPTNRVMVTRPGAPPPSIPSALNAYVRTDL